VTMTLSFFDVMPEAGHNKDVRWIKVEQNKTEVVLFLTAAQCAVLATQLAEMAEEPKGAEVTA
jgi:hypothetical protein